MQNISSRLALLALPLCLAAATAQAGKDRPPPLPEEEIRIERAAAPDGNRLYVTDFVFNHMVDGRVHVLDGKAARYLGVVMAGYGALTTVSADGKSIYVATTYYPRLYRGQRSDVVEIHDAETLELKAEIDIPPKKAQAASYRGMLVPSADGRFLYVQNATPATSVTVVDLHSKKFVAEIPTPGCWSIQGWDKGYRFSTICGDGTLMTVTLDEAGQPAGRERSQRFFDPDKDPIYVHPEMLGEDRYFVSYYGNLYKVTLGGDKPTFAAPRSLLDARDRKANWRPGGMAVTAMHRASGTLYVNMHDKGEEGSHKNPSKEIWAFDVASQKRVARIPSNGAISLAASQGAEPLLYSLNVEKGEIVARKIAKGYPVARTMSGVGETSLFMEVR
ncbi:amine dehydrogenase large subunit [Dechloromonas sp. ARDL1]|uniref:amine dehydrogenase large subunit n=1 Tax=Dechloromonas sp. ARDL1 TaxID=3322121 RepID=UPI003DA70B78